MGLFDNMTSALNRGRGAAERTGRSTRLKLQLSDLARSRRELAAQLGASLYDIAKDDPTLREGREQLFDGIANIDAQRADIEEELARIDEEAAAAREAAQVLVCPNCGNRLMGGQAFCTGCGASAEQIRAMLANPAPATPADHDGPVCVSCGAALQEGDLFCIVCGTKQPGPNEMSDSSIE